MSIEDFIEKAIEGGWKQAVYSSECEHCEGYMYYPVPGLAFLDPEAWKAVGKVEGWFDGDDTSPAHDEDVALACWCKPRALVEEGGTIYIHEDRTAQGYAHGLIDALFEGKTIEEYLATL